MRSGGLTAWRTLAEVLGSGGMVGRLGTARLRADLKPAAIVHDQSDEAMTDLDVKMKAIVDYHFIRVASWRQEQW